MKKLYTFNPGILLSFCFFIAAGELLSQGPFTGKPRYQILTTQNSTTLGIINVELFPNIAPKHVRNFDSLVNIKFYDTIAFHRVVPGFVIQGGDPNSRHGPVNTWGYGQPGQTMVPAEFSVAKHERGILSAARLGNNINSATSQFFICVAAASNLNGLYSIYGRVTSGMTTVDQIVNTPTVSGTQRPVSKIEMFVKYIGSNDTVPQPSALIAPKNDSSEVDTTVVLLKWNSVQDAIYYHLDVSHDSLFLDTVKSVDVTVLSYYLTYMPPKTKFYWKVRANNGGHWSVPTVWHFKTGPKEEEPVNTTGLNAIILNGQRTVFPNPSRDKFTFANNVPGDLIEVYDLSGRQVYKTVAEKRQVQVDFTEVTKGTYTYKISRDQKEIMTGNIILQ